MGEHLNKIYGIDLGTTNSSIAYVNEFGEAVVLNNIENESQIPSVTFFDGKEIVVGEVARESAKLYPNDVVSCVKRVIGEPDFFFQYQSEQYRPEEISSFILRKVVQGAEQTIGEKITDIVISCPAYFGINEREATRRAGEIAGYNVRQIINEPTAAAISYGIKDVSDKKVVLVYDLGGGTFDVTLIETEPNSIKVICTGGDHDLGGKDWDDRIVAYLAQEFKSRTYTEDDILDDLDIYHDLQLMAEKLKRTLSKRQKAPVNISYKGIKARFDLARTTFEEITQSLLERTIYFTRDMLKQAKKKGYHRFDDIILVGGATHMPQIADRIEEEFSMKPRMFSPEVAVAKGTAIMGWKILINDMLAEQVAKKAGRDDINECNLAYLEYLLEDSYESLLDEAIQEIADETGTSCESIRKSIIKITDVASKSFGVVAKNVEQGEFVYNMILRNTDVPVSVTKTFNTAVNSQGEVLVRIMENSLDIQNAPIDQSVDIGTAVLTLPTGTPKNSPVVIDFNINKEGMLEISAKESTGTASVDVTFETRAFLYGEELEEAKERHRHLMIQ